MKLRSVLQTLLVVFITIMMFACESPEEKKMNAFNRGDVFYEKGKYAEAKLEFKNAIQVDPEFTEAYYKLGMVKFKQGKIKEAYKNFSQAVKLSPEHLNSQLQLGRFFLAAKAADKALKKADLILKTDTENQDALFI